MVLHAGIKHSQPFALKSKLAQIIQNDSPNRARPIASKTQVKSSNSRIFLLLSHTQRDAASLCVRFRYAQL